MYKFFKSLCLSFIVTSASAAVTLNILEWEGYISPFAEDFTKYAKSKGMDVTLNILTPYIDNPEQIFTMVRRKAADVVTPTNNYFKGSNNKLIQNLLPLDTSKISNYDKVLKSLRSASYDSYEGGKYSVPLLGGSYGLAYNVDKASAPDSWNILWEPQSKDQYHITGSQLSANIYTTMLVLGYAPETFYSIENNQNFNEADVQKKLNELVINAHSFWSGMADKS